MSTVHTKLYYKIMKFENIENFDEIGTVYANLDYILYLKNSKFICNFALVNIRKPIKILKIDLVSI